MSSIALSPATTPTTTSNTAPAQPQKFLDHCVELLEPRAVAQLESDAYWKDVAGKAALVAFGAIYIGGLSAAIVYIPLYIVIGGYFAIAAAGISLLAITVAEYVNEKCFQASQDSSDKAASLNEYKRYYQELESYTPENLQVVLIREMGIVWFSIPGMLQNPENLNTLKPLIAYYRFSASYQQYIESQKQSILQEAENLAIANYDENREKIYDLRNQALELERYNLELKISIGFTLATIRQPNLTKRLNEIGDFSQLSETDRLITRELGNMTADHLFTFKNAASPPLTVDQVKLMSDLNLSEVILVAAQQ